jgi:hypothetical protein
METLFHSWVCVSKDAIGKISVDQPAYVEELVTDIWEESILLTGVPR